MTRKKRQDACQQRKDESYGLPGEDRDMTTKSAGNDTDFTKKYDKISR